MWTIWSKLPTWVGSVRGVKGLNEGVSGVKGFSKGQKNTKCKKTVKPNVTWSSQSGLLSFLGSESPKV